MRIWWFGLFYKGFEMVVQNGGTATDYKSTTMKCNCDPADCAVCRFLSGDREIRTMLEVIRVLDANLHEREIGFEYLAAALFIATPPK